MSLSLNQPCGPSFGPCGDGLACIQPSLINNMTVPSICMAIDAGTSNNMLPLSEMVGKRNRRKMKPASTNSTEEAVEEELTDEDECTEVSDEGVTDPEGQSESEEASQDSEELPPKRIVKKKVKPTARKKKKTPTDSGSYSNSTSSDSLITDADTFASLGPSMQGKTTRYWDCCKPSCSDPNNAGAVSNPVGSCKKDGFTLAPVADVNGCTGGNAFTCNSNQPMVINSTFALGFAAATIQGLKDQDKCCACYRLDFTSGSVQGKTMVVQVTNSGGDLATNQFDLQIPGGGVGIFNGCSPQWNAPSPDAWGQRYGGVGSANECSQLPKELQDGCKFKFDDFFKSADNPAINLMRVKCPAELVKRSGCKRKDE